MTPDWYPSTWDIIGSAIVYVLFMLPFVLLPYLGLRRLIKGKL